MVWQKAARREKARMNPRGGRIRAIMPGDWGRGAGVTFFLAMTQNSLDSGCSREGNFAVACPLQVACHEDIFIKKLVFSGYYKRSV